MLSFALRAKKVEGCGFEEGPCGNSWRGLHGAAFSSRRLGLVLVLHPDISTMASFRDLYKNDVDFAALSLQSKDFAQ
jgi:hypothetical protein